MTPVLITGSNGQLGRLLQLQFAGSKQYKIYTRDRSALDITDASALAKQFDVIKPQVVINCAAYTAVDNAELQPELCHRINVSAVEQLAKLCRQYGSLLITISSDYVFDGQITRPYTEHDATAPLSQYGKSKLLSEHAATLAGQFITLRTSWLFSEYGRNFVTIIRQRALTGAPTAVVTDQFGGPTPAIALASAIRSIVQQYTAAGTLPYGLYHFSGYPFCSWYEFATQIYRLVAPDQLSQLHRIISPFPGALAKRPTYSCLDMSLFQQCFNYQPPDWRVELAAIVNKLAN